MSSSILLPLDGSTFSEHALPTALDLARQLNARLHLVQVHEPPLPLTAGPNAVVEAEVGASLREQEEEYLRSVASRCMERAGIPTRTELLEGPVATSLAAYIQEMKTDLVVMTTHGRSGISRAWVGSVADAVVRRSAAPVLLLRPREGDEGPVEFTSRHVLVPLDGSPLAEGILPPAARIAQVRGARFTLLRVVAPLQVSVEPQHPAVLSQDPAVVRQAVTQAQAYLEDVAAPLRLSGLQVEAAVEVHPVAAVAILDYAATNSVDMVAMATHGRGGWSRVALGSVADKVMRGMLLPVLLFRPPAALVTHPVDGALAGHVS
ncbi:MAG TPA: universal stress protein [Longimicrobiales bacterium]|nr:universal stress protein [Longimicrobiales bacterium]